MFDQFMMQHATLLLVAIALVLATKEDNKSRMEKNAVSGPIKEPTMEDRRSRNQPQSML